MSKKSEKTEEVIANLETSSKLLVPYEDLKKLFAEEFLQREEDYKYKIFQGFVSHDELKKIIKEEFLQREYGRKCLITEILNSNAIAEKTQKQTKAMKYLSYDLIALNLMFFTSFCFESIKMYFWGLALLSYITKTLKFYYDSEMAKS